ncbi:hypothetical protein HQQ94_00750 [Shewanella sp. VB17]|uniref:hypothetical protein n=1 Tax=Shewanella sp. VB17 TaxID=2739432 RepID=UPI001566B6DE|nr:hypothetical protein [Shewanella sp. VB17]NRD71805.1 hypothetical protein [Shewanella sp. VB17]
MINNFRIIIDTLTRCYLFTFIGLPCLILLTACQSSIDQAQQGHKYTVDKWLALMQYGESTLPEYGITISAKLSQLPMENIHAPLSYQLKNIKLDNEKNVNKINLLSPWFNNKYICSPVCSQLTEYKSKTNRGNRTLLNYYFEEYKYDFYDFYVQVYQVNNQLAQLKKIQPSLVKDYLLYLVDQQAPQSSLVAFIELLKQSLSPQAYQEYLQDPKLLVGEYQPLNEGLPDMQAYKQTVKERDFWQDAAQGNSENVGWRKVADNNIEDLTWQKVADGNIEGLTWKKVADGNIEGLTWKKVADSNIEDLTWKKKAEDKGNQMPNDQVKQTEKTDSIPSREQWISSKNNPLEVGELACSYQENMFGKVIAVSTSNSTSTSTVDDIESNKQEIEASNSVTLSLFGQAKQVEDGVTSSHVSGYLFNTSQQAVSFKPIKGTKTFSADDIGRCLFQ